MRSEPIPPEVIERARKAQAERRKRQAAREYGAYSLWRCFLLLFKRRLPVWVGQIKVFKVNDCDWVAARTLDEAIEWYRLETGMEGCDWDDPIEDPHEDSLSAPMYSDEIRDGEPDTTVGKLIKAHAKRGWTFPCVIASTEY